MSITTRHFVLYGKVPPDEFVRDKGIGVVGRDEDAGMDRYGFSSGDFEADYFLLPRAAGTAGGRMVIRAFSNVRNSSEMSEGTKPVVNDWLGRTEVAIDCEARGNAENVNAFMFEFAQACSAIIMLRDDEQGRLFFLSNGDEMK